MHRVPPKVAIIGTGFMGRAMIWQSEKFSLLDCVAVYDINIDTIGAFLMENGIKYTQVNNAKEMDRAIISGSLAVCSDVRLILEYKGIEAVIDASSAISVAAVFCADVLNSGKHLIMLNAEADLMFGAYLTEIAKKNNVIYTSCDGDQYGVLKRIIDEIKPWGFQVVMAGNIKGFLDRYANEQSIAQEARKRGLNHKMCASYTDGTKLNVEMALIANSEGYVTKYKGMLGPRAIHVTDVFSSFDLEKLWEDRMPCVDYLLGAEPGGGVYVIGYCEEKFQNDLLYYYKMGKGPFYLFYRPYHLCHLECTRTVLDAVLEKKVLMQPRRQMMTNVFAYAKKDLEAGEFLDGPGGFTCYGLIENMADQKNAEGFPICLSDKVAIKRTIKKDEKVLLSDVEVDPARIDYNIYRKYKLREVDLSQTSAASYV
jgi:predicted homoserine dehydrogenase-like protein